jgi:hypothetical protein
MKSPTPTELIAYAIEQLGCTTIEARIRQTRRPDRVLVPEAVIVTVVCRDEPTRFLLAALAEALGASPSFGPFRLAGDRPLPIGLLLSLTLPWQDALGLVGLPVKSDPDDGREAPRLTS